MVEPIVVSTWEHGLTANEAAWAVLSNGGTALDAVEAAARVTESDPSIRSVGLGGYPDRDGRVTVDASIMDDRGNCGAVACLEQIEHPVSVARKVMEESRHVLLVGQGALDFALAHGFERRDLLTPETEAIWRTNPSGDDGDAHDTIGTLAIDQHGHMAGACTTSGARNKLPGRVGDSPIIGAGLFVDAAVGSACATGWGESAMRIAGSHLVVELMRQGHGPADACRLAVERILEGGPDRHQEIAFLALANDGRPGAHAVRGDFAFAVHDADGSRLIPAPSAL